jgi:tRNA A37 N6-isopentenylltransferase MiaA
LYRKAQNQALQKVRIAQSLADMMSRQLEDEVKAIHQLEKQKEVLEGVLFKQTQKLFQAKEELIKAEGRELGVYVTTRGRRVILGKRQRSLSK